MKVGQLANWPLVGEKCQMESYTVLFLCILIVLFLAAINNRPL